MTVAAYRDAGFWTLLWQICWSIWSDGRPGSFPPRGFVGLGSLSSVAGDLRYCKLKWVRLRRRHYTRAAPRWRLTLGWETFPPALRVWRRGRFLPLIGSRSADGGAGASRHPTTTISISRRSPSDDGLPSAAVVPQSAGPVMFYRPGEHLMLGTARAMGGLARET